MELLIDTDEHFKFLNDCVAKKPTGITIATYGIYAGILSDGRDTREWGDKYYSKTRELLESMRGIKDVRILIGLYDLKSCRGKLPCADCEKKYVLDLIRHLNHAEKFPEFKWKIALTSHIKCILFSYESTKLGIAGSRNFTDSQWDDVTITLGNSEVDRLENHINQLWDKARPLDGSNVNILIREQNVSEQALSLI